MRTPSLRRRAVLWSVGVLAALLTIVGFGVDFALGSVLRAEQQQRLESLAGLAQELTGLSDGDLADRLTQPGIRAQIVTASGETVVGVPRAPGRGGPAGPAPRPEVKPATGVRYGVDGRERTATFQVRSGATVMLSTDDTPIEEALIRFREIMAVASVIAVALAALLLPLVLGRAMRPLAALTEAARGTAGGDRGRRLAPKDPGTDLGRAAQQFDAMLEELEGAEARAEAAAEKLSRFLSDASHELRTPLAGVSAGAERLIREPLGDEERDRIAVQIVREARRSARLVDDLLLVSRLGDLRVQPRAVDLAGLIGDAAERLRARPGAPAVEVAATGVTGATVSVDRERTDQVLANLLVNAANAGSRRVRIRAAGRGADAVVRVSDDGPGVPPEAREAVFERLVRLDPARAAGRGGAGLGLPIARGLAEAQGGSLACVQPEIGDLPGAVFELRLPLTASAAATAPPAEVTPATSATPAPATPARAEA